MKKEIPHFEYGIDFQFDTLKMCTENIEFLLKCKKYVKPEYFSNERLQNFAKKIYQYHDSYSICPDKTFLKSLIKEKKDKILIKRILREREIKQNFIRDNITDFVRRSMFVEFYETSGKTYNAGKVDEAFHLVTDGISKINQISLKEDEFEFLLGNFDRRLNQREQDNNNMKNFKIPLGFSGIDRALKGGAEGGELVFYMGDAKSGKSFALIHTGTYNVKRFNTVLHIQLEGKKEQTLDRMDSCFIGALYSHVKNSNIPSEFVTKMRKIAKKRKKKDLIVRHYNEWNSCSVLDVERDYLNLCAKGIFPKLIVIDYFDLMKARGKYATSEERYRQTSIARDLKSFATKYNIVVLTATQTNRGIDTEDPNFIITSKNASEDYNKIRALDILMTINVSPEEYEKGYARLYLDTVRDNQSKKLFRIRRDLDHSRFYVRKKKK